MNLSMFQLWAGPNNSVVVKMGRCLFVMTLEHINTQLALELFTLSTAIIK